MRTNPVTRFGLNASLKESFLGVQTQWHWDPLNRYPHHNHKNSQILDLKKEIKNSHSQGHQTKPI